MRLLGWISFGLLLTAASCTNDLDNARCDCEEKAGYVCCEATNRCVRKGSFCPAGQGGATVSAQGGMLAQAGSSGAATSGAATSGAGSGGTANGGTANGSAASGAVATGGVPNGGSAGNNAAGGVQAGSGGAGSSAAANGGSGPVKMTSGGAATGGAATGGAAAGGAVNGGTAGAPSGVGGAAEPKFTSVPTQHNDMGRSGANLSETTLDASNVKPATFGELSRRPLRGAVFAQPLVVTDVPWKGRKADVLYVATMANEVYALDAHAPEQPPLWVRSLGPSIVLREDATETLHAGSGNIWHEIGIYGTPVAVPADDALYVVAATREDGKYLHRVHKLRLSTGEVVNSNLVQRAGFDSGVQAQLSALAVAGGKLFVAFGGYANDGSPGFVFAYDTNLALVDSVSLGNPGGGGVTMSGQGPASADDATIFFTTSPSISDNVFSRLFEMKYGVMPPLIERLYPFASSKSSSNELGHGGPLMVPNSDRMLVAGQHRFYVLNRRATNPQQSLVQEFRASAAAVCEDVNFACGARPNSPIFWAGNGQSSSRIFVWSPNDLLRSFQFDDSTGRVACPGAESVCPAFRSASATDSDDDTSHLLTSSAQLSLSANGTRSGSGIVWATHPFSTDTARSPDGILRAYDADNLGLIWSTEKTLAPFGPIAPTMTATVSGGHVFAATAAGHSNKYVFGNDWTGGAPGVTNFADRFLVVAWGMTQPESRAFQIAWSSDGVHFGNASPLVDKFLNYEPALAADDSQIFIAYTVPIEMGIIIRVAASSQPDFSEKRYLLARTANGTLEPLNFVTELPPALLYGGGRLFLAWNHEGAIRVVSSRDGVAFDSATLTTIPNQFSYSPPALAYVGDKLYLVTTDFDHNMSLYVSDDQGAHFQGPQALPMQAAGHPAFLWASPESTQQPDFFLIWTEAPGTASQGRIKVATAAHGDVQAFSRIQALSPEEALGSISAARFRGAWYFTWQGVGDQPHPNVARYTPGELVTYGLGGR